VGGRLMHPRGTGKRRRLHEQVARQQAEWFVRLVSQDPPSTPAPPPHTADHHPREDCPDA
jgi:hypothetical protein